MAMEPTQEQHNPGSLKQQNKQHKHGRHKSKGFLQSVNKGKTLMRLNTRKSKHDLRKEERRNQAAQIRHKKREEMLKVKRGLSDAPFLIAVIPLSRNIKAEVAMAFLKAADSESVITYSTEGQVHISVPRFKQRFCFVECNNDNLFDVLDVLKVADTVLFVVSVEGIQSEGELLLTTALAQGLPTTVVTLVDLLNLPPKKRQDGKIHLQKQINRWLPNEKLMTLEKVSDGLMVLRRIGNQKQRSLIQRDKRPHLLAERTEFVPNPQGGLGIVKLTGYLRGKSLSVNSLVHISGWGEYQMRQIDGIPDPQPIAQPKNKENNSEQDIEVLEVADPSKQESLDSENIPDPMEGEQTWPTADELKEADENIKKFKRVPVGMSDYQAAWIPDSDAEEVDEIDEVEDKMQCDIDAQSEEVSEDDDSNETDTMTVTSEGPPIPVDKYDQETNLTEEQETLKKIKDARSDQMFPDEVDTPMDIPARVRFQKYRGLKSFRTSPWDPKENLPQEYARIFQFQRFDRTHKRILQELEDSACEVLPGSYITIHIDGISEDLFMSRLGTQPLVVYGMLPYEQKMSVVNMVLKRPTCLESYDPIKSKEQLIFQCGYRRFKACPIFSQHTNGAKHKYERYFQADGTVVATVFAPIMFPPASVLAFKEKKDGTLNLVATGSLLSVNPDRIVVKRLVLSGHPLKVHKRSAVIRYMFFNREDIEWFKPVEISTKNGRRGHIKEPLGTHGHMKCIFDGQLKSQDTVLMTLYKRVFPKWSYDPVVTVSNSHPSMETD